MFETLQRLYNEGKLTIENLTTAVNRLWITEEQKQEIISQ